MNRKIRHRQMSLLARVAIATGVLLALFASPVLASVESADETSVQNTIISIKNNISVENTNVSLRDLFNGLPDNLSSNADASIATISSPGQSVNLNARKVQVLAARADIKWSNDRRLERIVVSRSSQTISNEVIAQALVEALRETISSSDVQLTLNSHLPDILIPTTANASVIVENLKVDPRNHFFQAVLRYPSDDPNGGTLRVAGKAIPLERVPVLVNSVQRNEILSDQDIEFINQPVAQIGVNVITNPASIIGKQIRRSLRAGSVLRASDLSNPMIVEKGALVTMSYNVPGMSLTDTGRAMESGATGDVIPILNPRSKRTVFARITAPNRATVAMKETLVSAR